MTKFGVTLGPPRAEPLAPRGDATTAHGEAMARRPVPLAHGASVGGIIAGKYRIERVIGHGGMGVVVAASHLALQRTVAIKLIRGDWADDPLAVERLVREARALASIQSQHVARVLDVGTLDDGIPFIVMEYLEGHDLDTLLRREGALPVAEAVDYLVQACEALAEAHRNGIVHRDIKPANLFLARQPGGAACIKVVDFGISKLINSSVESLTHPSRIVGSLYHMAPEQISGEAVDARTDVWALGVLSFELLTGRKPFQGGAWPAVFARVLSETEPPQESLGAHVPREVQSAVRRCLQRQPQDRFPNVAELAVALAPFGTRIARASLEHIVRLATSTGSLAAQPTSPLPPALDPAARAGGMGAGSGAFASVGLAPSAGAPSGGAPSGESLRAVAPPPRPTPLPRASRRPPRWLLVCAAALVVVGVPWLVTRLLRAPVQVAPAAQVARGAGLAPAAQLASPSPSVAQATPALLPAPAPGGAPAAAEAPVAGAAAPGGHILAPRVAEPAPSPHPNEPPAAPRIRVWAAPSAQLPPPAAHPPAGQPPAGQPPAGQPPAGQPPAALAPPAPPGPAPTAAPAASKSEPPAPSAGAAAARLPQPAQQPGAAQVAPRGADPWDLRDLEFE